MNEDQVAALTARSEALRLARQRSLLREYGPDMYRRGDVLIFRPQPDEADQEVRAAVKRGPDEWTLTGRGNRHTWIAMLELAGSGHQLSKLANSVPVTSVTGYVVD